MVDGMNPRLEEEILYALLYIYRSDSDGGGLKLVV